ncbi:MAG: hypothetical protein LBR11_10385 [Deltaproteobacteria bacterium]|jgi:hypothetical protein|nr:hypothetical protein [Deltaproteobacteria bacterium]
MIWKLALVNLSAVIGLILAYNLRNIIQHFIGNTIFINITIYSIFSIILIINFYLSYIILFRKERYAKPSFDGQTIESIPRYIQLLTEYLKNNTYTFKKDILNIITLCEKFNKKNEIIRNSIQNYFNKNELSYMKITAILNGVASSFAVTANNILIRLNSFDAAEYEDIFRQKHSPGDNLEKRQKIFDEYKEFLKSSGDFLDEILIKMDQLQLEISKLSSLDYEDIEKNELLKEIDSLVKTMKLYK